MKKLLFILFVLLIQLTFSQDVLLRRSTLESFKVRFTADPVSRTLFGINFIEYTNPVPPNKSEFFYEIIISGSNDTGYAYGLETVINNDSSVTTSLQAMFRLSKAGVGFDMTMNFKPLTATEYNVSLLFVKSDGTEINGRVTLPVDPPTTPSSFKLPFDDASQGYLNYYPSKSYFTITKERSIK